MTIDPCAGLIGIHAGTRHHHRHALKPGRRHVLYKGHVFRPEYQNGVCCGIVEEV